MAPPPQVVLVAHGTRRAAGRATVGALVDGVRRRLPDAPVRLAHVDVQAPTLAQVMGRVRAVGARAVVVPVLLSTGYHVDVDIAGAVDDRLDVVTPPLGPDPLLAEIGADRWRAVGAAADHLVVLGAGSSRERARDDVAVFAADLAAAVGLPTSVGWIATGAPDTGAAVVAAPGRVGAVPYLVGEGRFARQARDLALAAGAVGVAGVLGPDPRLAELVVRRVRAAVG